MTTWADYIPWVSIQVSMVPRDLHIAALRQSAIVLCEKSHCWKEWLEPWGVSTGERDIEVEHPDGARIGALAGMPARGAEGLHGNRVGDARLGQLAAED